MSRQLLRTAFRPFGISIFSEMTRLANAHKAINLAQGFPDFDGPPRLMEAAAAAMREGHNQYAPSQGIPSLREAIVRQVESFCGITYDPGAEVTVTSGATEAMWSTAMALLEPGDEVIVIEPFYDAYPFFVAAAGAICRYATLEFPDFTIDIDEIAALCNSRTRMIFLNTPMNPTGKAFSEEEIRQIGNLAEKHDLFIVADEVYAHILFDGKKHVSVPAVDNLRERTILVSSVSKTFSATGWRVGWLLAPAEITSAVRMVHQYVTFAAATPLQHGVAAALEWAEENDYYELLRDEYAERRDVLLDVLVEMGVDVSKPDGTFFIMTRCTDDFEDDVDYCRWLIQDVGVAAVPSSFFFDGRRGGHNLVRFVFCKQIESLHQAARKLRAGLTRR